MIKAFIIDDEKHSREILEWQIAKHCTDIKILASIGSPAEAIEGITKLKPDLVFLDIQMPEINGFELLERMNPIDFEVIFTTAFNEHAVKAFKYNALDYLLKPIDVIELKASIAKVTAKLKSREDVQQAVAGKEAAIKEAKAIKEAAAMKDTNSLEDASALETHVEVEPPVQWPKRMALTTTNSLIFIEPDNILYCQGESNYTNVHTNTPEKKVLITRTLREIEDVLVAHDFFRIHNSHIINMKHVKEYVRGGGGYVVMSDGTHLTVARSRKDEFFENFNKF